MTKKFKVIELTGDIMPSEYKPVNKTEIAESILGRCARLLSFSKTLYHETYPNNFVIFNANVCTEVDGKIWFGDIDITRDEKLLKELDKQLDAEIFVMYEMACRFETAGRKGNIIEQYASWSTRRGDLRASKI